MCGISGVISYHNNLKNSYDIIKNMSSKLSFRGPDSEGYFIDTNVLLGHKRLIVVDPAGGKQPMIKHHLNNEYTIVYNGELYNTEELRATLISCGYTFDSYSDTEVLLTSYIHWGEECVSHLNGIFAFAIWEKLENKLFLARDPVGVKPLFYTISDNSLIFGSEIKVLLAHPSVKAEIDQDGLLELFSLGPATNLGSGVFKNIKEIPPAYCATFDKNNFYIREYWKVSIEHNKESLDDATLHLKDLLIDSIKRQLVGDVPLCTFLSGGLDSSAISAIASSSFKEKGKVLTTYSIDFDGNDMYFKGSDFIPTSDEYWANQMSKYIGSNHISVKLSNENLASALKDAVIARDLPGMADIDSSLLLFCKEIRKDFVVGLSGECADELFGGYPWYIREDLINSTSFPWSQHLNNRKFLLNDSLKQIDLEGFAKEKYIETIKEVPTCDFDSKIDKRIRELFYLNIKWFMINLLNRKDRMSMRTSLEVRVPFADYRLLQYAFNIPRDIKFTDNREKGLLRRSLIGVLPNDIIYRKKSPYPKTHNPIYTNLVCSELQNIISKPTSPINQLLNKTEVENLINSKGSSYTAPWFGQLMTGPQLIAYLIQINYWLEFYNINILL